jgi:hypothetical protein
MKRWFIFLIPVLFCAGPNFSFSQEDSEKSGRDGRYHAVEFSLTETAPVNISLKTGLDKIYASLYFSYNQFESNISNQISCGVGIGSIFSMGNIVFFNPEVVFFRGAGGSPRRRLCFAPCFGFRLPHDMEFLIGPALSWNTGKRRPPPFLKPWEYKINEGHTLSLSGQAALRILW